MSGFGERFRRAGYTKPKPLIHVEGKPIIQHVTELFEPGSNFIFIVNETHLDETEYGLQSILKGINPDCQIVAIPPHRLGPVHACLAASHLLDPKEEVVVNYADFTCLWNFQEFLLDARSRRLHGSVPAYRGFHPHSSGSTNYAYIQEKNLRLHAIREKQPFTADKTQEFASTGTYYFQKSSLMVDYFQQLIKKRISVNGEYYASSAFDLMAKDSLDVGVYEIQHFMQWGTPEDLDEYNYWSNSFRLLASLQEADIAADSSDYLHILASGKGERFASVGYGIPKPALQIGGRTLLEQVSKARRKGAQAIASVPRLSSYLFEEIKNLNLVEFPGVTDGQATSTRYLLEASGIDESKCFSVLPSDTLFADQSDSLKKLLAELVGEPFIIPWVTPPSPYAKKNPNSFGWLVESPSSVSSYIKSQPPSFKAKVMSGAFTFSSLSDFIKLYDSLVTQSITVNGEFYLDSLVKIANDLGFTVRLFEPTYTLSVGTPYEFETFRYWQSAFDRWESHPYSLESDPFIDKGDVEEVRSELLHTKHQPTEWHGRKKYE